jgi:hypothetical protein
MTGSGHRVRGPRSRSGGTLSWPPEPRDAPGHRRVVTGQAAFRRNVITSSVLVAAGSLLGAAAVGMSDPDAGPDVVALGETGTSRGVDAGPRAGTGATPGTGGIGSTEPVGPVPMPADRARASMPPPAPTLQWQAAPANGGPVELPAVASPVALAGLADPVPPVADTPVADADAGTSGSHRREPGRHRAALRDSVDSVDAAVPDSSLRGSAPRESRPVDPAPSDLSPEIPQRYEIRPRGASPDTPGTPVTDEALIRQIAAAEASSRA